MQFFKLRDACAESYPFTHNAEKMHTSLQILMKWFCNCFHQLSPHLISQHRHKFIATVGLLSSTCIAAVRHHIPRLPVKTEADDGRLPQGLPWTKSGRDHVCGVAEARASACAHPAILPGRGQASGPHRLLPGCECRDKRPCDGDNPTSASAAIHDTWPMHTNASFNSRFFSSNV